MSGTTAVAVEKALEQQTYMPSTDSDESVAEIFSFIEAHESTRGVRPAPRYFLAGSTEGDQVEIPAEIHQILVQVVAAMKAGKAVTVMPQNRMVTTQQAADLLGVSRPTVVGLLDDGKLPFQRPGKRRRMVRLDDVLKYRAERREAQYQALMETSANYDDEGDPEEELASLRQVRSQLAKKRAARS